MDATGVGDEDDQGSGWFQVKKKHRSSSKFSIRNWVGGSSKQQASGKGRNVDNKNQSHVSKPGKDGVQRSLEGHLTSMEDGKDECCHDKSVVDDENGFVKPAPLNVIATTENTSVVTESLFVKKSDIVHKIKWGDLEDDVLAPENCSSAVSEIRFGEIGDDDLAKCETSRNMSDLIACNSANDRPSVSKEILEVCDAASDACPNMVRPVEDSLEENCKEVSEVASVNVGIPSSTSNVVNDINNHLDSKDLANEDVDPLNKDLCSFEISAHEFPCSSTVTVADDEAEVIITEDTEAAPSDQCLPEVCRTSNCEVGDNKSLLSVTSKDSLLSAPLVNTVGEREGESKERFRERLWSFLFENLNRAVDELYLLCELECDFEQVKEAILVLQEAESDFRELNVRVEDFDKMKKTSFQSTGGACMSMKGDHRRPHALSWEVRRMTTSPHRAEILSSSLEAFKKVQEERAKERAAGEGNVTCTQILACPSVTLDSHNRSIISETSEPRSKLRRKSVAGDAASVNISRERRVSDCGRSSKMSVQSGRLSSSTLDPNASINTSQDRRGTDSRRSSKTSVQNGRLSPPSSSDRNTNKLPPGINSTAPLGGRVRQEQLGSSTEMEKHNGASEKERDRRKSQSWRPSDAWKEKRNWEEILASPCRLSSRLSYSPCMSRKSAERARILHDKLMSPEKKKKTALDLKKEAAEKHARATRIRNELESERIQKLQRTSEKLNRVSERQAVRSMKLKEGMYARHQQSESRHEAYLAKVVKRAGDETNKVNEVRFITSLNEENKKFILRQKLHDSELRRAEKIQVLKTKQKEDVAREEAVMERRKLIEAEKLQRLAEIQRRKEEAQLRREEERKASSAAREARAIEQQRRKEERAKAQQEEAELLAQRLAERLRESEQRRKVYLEQIRERASMDFRDQSSPFMRRVVNKEGQGRTTSPGNVDDSQENPLIGSVNSSTGIHQSLKRRIKKIRQRLMALKHEHPDIPATENSGIGYRTSMATARAKIGRWVQELQRLRQERKEGAASIGLIVAEMIKFLEGKELELLVSRRAGLLDFISSALPASHISKPEASQVTIYFLRLLKVVLFVPANKSYFLSQNLLPPLIPMLSAALESYIKIAASLNVSGSSNSQPTKTSCENFDSISEVLDGFLCTVTMIIGFPTMDDRQRQMQDGLLELVISYQIIHRLRDLFALYDRPQVEGSPFPSSILLSINFLVILTSRPCAVSPINWECFPVSKSEDSKLCGEAIKREQETIAIESKCDENEIRVLEPNVNTSLKEEKNVLYNGAGSRNEDHIELKQPHAFILSAISETGLVSLPSLLTAVLLQANNKSFEQGSYVLPSNFEEVATGVLKVLNNLALMDITFMQQILARLDLKMEFFHIMSFLLTHCTNSWKVASDQVGLLLLESLLLLGYFSLLHPGNQAVLRWGNSPTILHKVCDLPFAFFSDPELMPILAGTLVAACFGCEQNKDVVQQELSPDMILSLVKSSRTSLPPVQSTSPSDNLLPEDSGQLPEIPLKPIRSTTRNSRLLTGRSGAGITKNSKLRNPKDGKANKISEDATTKPKLDATSEAHVTPPLYARFPESFIERAEKFFSMDPTCGEYDGQV
ncbi:uncharacterized protein LOC141638681 [Silene latifolia]|uniref:uncharacterized protein LOC141638681 n=1 Tax=Silene latifolia TaxID=37657 RepID=UPI003D77DBB4